MCNVKEGGIALCNENASRPPRTQILVPPFFWRGFFFGPFSTTAKTSVQYLLELQRDWARTETYDATTGWQRHLEVPTASASSTPKLCWGRTQAPSLSPSPLDEAHRARILSANIIRLDKFGHPCARGILDHVAGVEDLPRQSNVRCRRGWKLRQPTGLSRASMLSHWLARARHRYAVGKDDTFLVARCCAATQRQGSTQAKTWRREWISLRCFRSASSF